MEFLQSYGKVLGFDPAKDVPSLCTLQEGLLGVGDSAGEVQDLLVRLLQAALYDPGLPPYCQVSQPRPLPQLSWGCQRPQEPGCCRFRMGEPRFGRCCSCCSLLHPLSVPSWLLAPGSPWGAPLSVLLRRPGAVAGRQHCLALPSCLGHPWA